MPASKEELQERAQLDEANFRIAIMKQLGTAYKLRELRTTQITGPVAGNPTTAQMRKPQGK